MKVKKELKKDDKELIGVEILNNLLKNNYNPKYQLNRKKGVDVAYAEKLSRELFS